MACRAQKASAVFRHPTSMNPWLLTMFLLLTWLESVSYLPMDTLTSAGACLVCLKKPKFQRAGFLSWNNVLLVTVCVSILSFWVQRGADLLTRESRSAHQGASQAAQAPRIRQCWELRAPAAIRHLKLSWSYPRIKTSPLICEAACVSSKANQSLYFRLPA